MLSAATQKFLSQFYASPNALTWDKIESAVYGDRFKPYLSRLDRKIPASTILPFMERDKSYTWFAIAFDETSFIQLRELIRSFIGPTYSDFSPFRSNTSEHPQDRIVQEYTDGYFLKFRGDDKSIGEKVKLLFKLLGERPDQRAKIPQNPQPMLHKFELALQAREEEVAAEQITTLERYQLIDPRNALFMRIEMLARLEQWQRLLEHPQMNDLLKASRPARITESIIRAIYAVYLEPVQSDPFILKEKFEEVIWPQYQSLYQSRGSLTHPHTLVSFMLRAVLSEREIPQLRDELLAIGAGTSVETLLRVLASQASGMPVVTPLEVTAEMAKSLIEHGDFDRAFEIALQLPDSKERTQFILLCAYEIQSLSVERMAVEALSHIQDDEWAKLLPTRHLRSCRDYLFPPHTGQQGKNQSALPGNWNEWFSSVDRFDHFILIDLAKRGLNEWPRDGFLDQASEMDRLIQYLQAFEDSEREAIHFARLYLLQYFKEDPLWHRMELKYVYRMLYRFFLIGIKGNREELKIIAEWSNTIHRMGLTSLENRQLFEDLTKLWKMFASVEFLQYLIPLIQDALGEPNLDKLSCLRFIHQVRARLSGKSILSDQCWLAIEEHLIPCDWESWFNLLEGDVDDYSFLTDWISKINDSYGHWTPNVIQQCNETISGWIVEEQPPMKKALLGRVISPFVQFVVQDPQFPASEETDFYENIADAMRTFSAKNEQTLQQLNTLLAGLLLRKPESVSVQWRETRQWLTFQPIVHLLPVVFDFMELFTDYGVLGMEMKSLWDDWVGVLYDNLDEHTESLRPYLISLGERIGGNYHTLEHLKKSVLTGKLDNDPLEKLNDMKITIFSCREKAANRAADQIMLRNNRLKVRVCTSDRATDQTTSFARLSDLSIVVTSCISHALTYGIREKLAHEPIYPRSSGEAGIVSRLEEYAMKGK